MGFEYKIRFDVPAGYTSDAVSGLPDPRGSEAWPAYDYALESYGFYFLDHGRSPTAAVAFRRLVDEALRHSTQVVIEEL